MSDIFSHIGSAFTNTTQMPTILTRMNVMADNFFEINQCTSNALKLLMSHAFYLVRRSALYPCLACTVFDWPTRVTDGRTELWRLRRTIAVPDVARKNGPAAYFTRKLVSSAMSDGRVWKLTRRYHYLRWSRDLMSKRHLHIHRRPPFSRTRCWSLCPCMDPKG